MDDFSITGARLTQALRDLHRINRLFGGHAATDAVLDPELRQRDHVRLLDLGCGSGDYLVHLARRGAQFGCTMELIGVDANPVTVGHARAHLDEQLPRSLRSQVRVEIGDALAFPCDDNAVDITHAALFLHHFHGDAARRLLRQMQRVSRHGIVVNDLHRHPLAWIGIWLLSRGLRMAPMVQHDGPMSVRRGFRADELRALAQAAGLPVPSIRWHWAFRWTLSTISNGD